MAKEEEKVLGVEFCPTLVGNCPQLVTHHCMEGSAMVARQLARMAQKQIWKALGSRSLGVAMVQRCTLSDECQFGF